MKTLSTFKEIFNTVEEYKYINVISDSIEDIIEIAKLFIENKELIDYGNIFYWEEYIKEGTVVGYIQTQCPYTDRNGNKYYAVNIRDSLGTGAGIYMGKNVTCEMTAKFVSQPYVVELI